MAYTNMSDTAASIEAIQKWFAENYGEPTEIQQKLWRVYPDTAHLLVISPTGSGKTMAMFFPVLLELLFAETARTGIPVVYISPLKALNTDMRRNLIAPLEALRNHFAERGDAARPVRIAVRSGDSTARERKAVMDSPPDILATTPESLQILLLSGHAKKLFSGTRLVIIDEIHALAGTKRGALLWTLLELLGEYAPGMRRAALSATVRNEDAAARALGGYDASGEPRGVTRIRAEAGRLPQIITAWPVLEHGSPDIRDTLARLGPACRQIIDQNRSTLFFTNSRRLAERMASLINHEYGAEAAHAHHGSLSRELRLAVENALKQGQIRAVAATASLELGIDIGQLDAVALIGTPAGVARAIQRIGRAAHHPGGQGRVILFPTHARDALEGFALTEAAERGAIEELRIPDNPLDVLAQAILTICAARERPADEIFALIKRSAPFASLPRADFESVLLMLAGFAGGRRQSALPPRVRYADGVVTALPAALFLLRTRGGTIPQGSALAMRDAESKAVLGELDEEFVFERRVGDVFRFANRVWRYLGQDDQGVLVTQLANAEGLMPFWRAEAADSSDAVIAELLGLFDVARENIDTLRARIRAHTQPDDAEALCAEAVRYIEGHQTDAWLALPGKTCIIAEEIAQDSMPGRCLCLLTARGGRVHRALSLGFAAWAARNGMSGLRFHLDNDSLLISGLPEGRSLEAILRDFFMCFNQDLVAAGLGQSRYFGKYFREIAARSLVLPRDMPGRYRPFWKFRERARVLLANLAEERDLPLFRETTRECLTEAVDVPGALALTRAVLEGSVAVKSYAHDAPSPMAQGVLWARTNELLYADDTPLRPARVTELPQGSLSEEAAGALVLTREGLSEGYIPADADALIDWLRLRILVSEELWRKALSGLKNIPEAEIIISGGSVCARADFFTVQSIREGDPDAAAAFYQWLSWRGIETMAGIAAAFQTDAETIDRLLAPLLADERVCRLSGGGIITQDNLDWILRRARAARRLQVQSLRPIAELPLFTAALQGVFDGLEGITGLALALERIFGCFLPAELFESEILPLRLAGYQPPLLDALFAEGDLLWVGDKKKRIAIIPRIEAAVYYDFPRQEPRMLPNTDGSFGFEALLRLHGKDSAAMAALLWQDTFAGAISNTSWQALRSGIAGGFRNADAASAARVGGLRGIHGQRPPAFPLAPGKPSTAGFLRWRRERPDQGAWFSLLPFADPEKSGYDPHDPLAENARTRARLDLVFQRWGVLSRETAQASGLFPSWHRVWRELTRMEMEGEIVAGRYFTDLAGVQFMPSALLPLFEHLENRARHPFLAASCDPIFPPIPNLWQGMRGRSTVICTKRGIGALLTGGRRLIIHDPAVYTEIADVLLERQRARTRTLTIREVTGTGREELIAALLERGARRCVNGIELGWRG